MDGPVRRLCIVITCVSLSTVPSQPLVCSSPVAGFQKRVVGLGLSKGSMLPSSHVQR